jgi:hypothetical protein
MYQNLLKRPTILKVVSYQRLKIIYHESFSHINKQEFSAAYINNMFCYRPNQSIQTEKKIASYRPGHECIHDARVNASSGLLPKKNPHLILSDVSEETKRKEKGPLLVDPVHPAHVQGLIQMRTAKSPTYPPH